MIECYHGSCRHHESQHDQDSGPFCAEQDCRATPQELQQYEQERVIYLQQLRKEQA